MKRVLYIKPSEHVTDIDNINNSVHICAIEKKTGTVSLIARLPDTNYGVIPITKDASIYDSRNRVVSMRTFVRNNIDDFDFYAFDDVYEMLEWLLKRDDL